MGPVPIFTNHMPIKISSLDIKEIGTVKEVKQGIIKVEGLPSCIYGQLVQFPQGEKGMVMGFSPLEVLTVVFSQESNISVGDVVSSSEEIINIPVGDGYKGRIVNALGEPLDGKGDIAYSEYSPVFREAAGVMEREPIEELLCTGTKIIDLAIPIGKGQRELIIGDRQSGKSTIGLDAIINQKGKDVVCIYCWIGGAKSALKKHLQILSEKQALEYTTVFTASADNSAAEQYLVPYSAAALGEYFMYKGRDVLVVFDDLTKHAWMYRQMSLLLERSPGREAYPGDIFYVHSQLMERAAKLNKEKGSGSMTFLPIVETLQGDITGYIQSNLVSMTDGQIYFNTALFKEGFKPAIDLGLSVSRIGNKAQSPALREVSGGLRLEYAQYREMLRLTKMRTRLSAEALEKMRRGDTLRKLLLQVNNEPFSAEKEIVLFYAFQRKVLEVLSSVMLNEFLENFFDYFTKESPDTAESLRERGELTTEIKKDLDKILVKFFKKLKQGK